MYREAEKGCDGRMTKITEDIQLCKFDGVSVVSVYKGGFDNLKKADLNWRKERNKYMGDLEFLKLSEIVEQLQTKIITVFIDKPMEGRILQYGNYGDEWYEIGTTCGYW